MSNEYIRGLQSNKQIAADYYKKSIVKTEQQKLLESILARNGDTLKTIADIACGGGTLSYHLSALYPDARFYLTDLNEEAIAVAKEVCDGPQFHHSVDNIYELKTLPAESFDALFCWQTLSWIDEPEKALNQMLPLVKKGGKLYLSALFNIDHDVDVYAKVKDHTREGDSSYSYNTYSARSMKQWIGDKVQSLTFHPFHPEIDFSFTGKGLGTYTIPANGKRLQFSGGMLLNWAIVEITK